MLSPTYLEAAFMCRQLAEIWWEIGDRIEKAGRGGDPFPVPVLEQFLAKISAIESRLGVTREMVDN